MKKVVSGITYEQAQELIKKMLYSGKFAIGGSALSGHSFSTDNNITTEDVLSGADIFRIEHISEDEDGKECRAYWTDSFYGVADIWSSYGGYLWTSRGDGCKQMRELEIELSFTIRIRDRHEKITTEYIESATDVKTALTKVKERLIGWRNCFVLDVRDKNGTCYLNTPTLEQL